MTDHSAGSRDATRVDCRRLVKLLGQGPGAALTAKQIEHYLGLPARTLREIVLRVRTDGGPIASDNLGYYFATSPEELDASIGRKKSQIEVMAETVRVLERLRVGLGEQGRLL